MIKEEICYLKGFEKNNDGAVVLSLDNVKLAELVYSILYRKSTLKDDFDNLSKSFTKDNLMKVCETINSENSTHLRNYEKVEICEVIMSDCKTIDSFKSKLQDHSYPLIKLIRGLKGRQVENEKKLIRDNYSFATKFCHYACYYIFKEDKDRDLYPIYDSVLVDYIKQREEYKNSDKKDLNDYKNYVSIIDSIIEYDEKISHNGFDHLIWLTNR